VILCALCKEECNHKGDTGSHRDLDAAEKDFDILIEPTFPEHAIVAGHLDRSVVLLADGLPK
jgi:hypothetical protein